MRRKTLVSQNISKYSMCISPKEKLSIFCSENGKPQPTYQQTLQGGKYRVTVYVAKTCGRVTGGLQPSLSDPEEDAAEVLAKKLHLF